MFLSNFNEAKDGRVRIEDFSAEVMKQVLNYIYTGRMTSETDEENIAMELLAAGHKYCIEGIQVGNS